MHWFLIPDAQPVVGSHDICGLKVLESLVGIICEDDIRCFRPAVCASFVLVECPQSQGTNVACLVVARCYRDMRDGAGADEADLLVVDSLLLPRGLVTLLLDSILLCSNLLLDLRGSFGQGRTEAAIARRTTETGVGRCVVEASSTGSSPTTPTTSASAAGRTWCGGVCLRCCVGHKVRWRFGDVR
jgi:hypothetical protein